MVWAVLAERLTCTVLPVTSLKRCFTGVMVYGLTLPDIMDIHITALRRVWGTWIALSQGLVAV